MSTVISIIVIIFLLIGSFYGLLISLEYLKYFRRKIQIKLNSKNGDSND